MHLTVYDSYNAKWVAKMMENIELANTSNAYSAANTIKFDASNHTQKHMLWKQFVACHYDGYSAASISDYINNPVFQEPLLKSDYFGNKFDKKMYIDLRDSLGYTNEIEKLIRNDSNLTVTIELKNAIMHKMRLWVWGYINGEYLYMLVDGGLTLKYKTYTIKLQDDALEACKIQQKKVS